MKVYFLRRLLLVPVTLFGITLLVFILMRAAPGGPVQRDLQEMMGAAASEQGGSAGMRESEGLAMTPEQLFEIEEKHRREKGALRSYLEWVGILPRDVQRTARSFKKGEVKVSVPVPATVMVAEVVRDGEGAVEIRAPEDLSAKKQQDLEKRIEEYDWKVRLLSLIHI